MHKKKSLPTIRKTHVLQSSVELKIDTKKREVSFKRTFDWLKTYLLPSLYMVNECVGTEKLLDMIISSKSRLSNERLKMIEKYREETSSMD